MATRRTRNAKSLTLRSMELALSVPQVVAHRVTRMTLAGPKLSDRDRKEFQMMVNEKHAAFAQAWCDMLMHAFHANQAFTASMLRFFFTPFSYNKPSAASAAAQFQKAAIGVLGKGLAPIHRITRRTISICRPRTAWAGRLWVRALRGNLCAAKSHLQAIHPAQQLALVLAPGGEGPAQRGVRLGPMLVQLQLALQLGNLQLEPHNHRHHL
jgi:hypothetical protein